MNPDVCSGKIILKVHYIRISHLSGSYLKQMGGLHVTPLTAANCSCSQLVSSVSGAACSLDWVLGATGEVMLFLPLAQEMLVSFPGFSQLT